MTSSIRTAVLLIAHGSRRPEANADLYRLAELVAEEGRYPVVEVAFLELTSPTIPEGGQRCVERGGLRVLMLPYFLSAGVHVVQDLEAFRRQLAESFPAADFRLCPPLGLHPLLVQVVLKRLEETVPPGDE